MGPPRAAVQQMRLAAEQMQVAALPTPGSIPGTSSRRRPWARAAAPHRRISWRRWAVALLGRAVLWPQLAVAPPARVGALRPQVAALQRRAALRLWSAAPPLPAAPVWGHTGSWPVRPRTVAPHGRERAMAPPAQAAVLLCVFVSGLVASHRAVPTHPRGLG